MNGDGRQIKAEMISARSESISVHLRSLFTSGGHLPGLPPTPAGWNDPGVASTDLNAGTLEDPLAMARDIVARELKGLRVRVFLFGSRAHGRPAPSSDIDIALLAETPLPRAVLGRIREAFEESTIPFRVDVVDLAAADEAFREAVLAEAVEWTA